MLDTRRNKVTRYKVAISIDRDSSEGEELAYMFIAPAQRVTDVLNDEREFLPFERMDLFSSSLSERFVASRPWK
jgi:hypothetical protein